MVFDLRRCCFNNGLNGGWRGGGEGISFKNTKKVIVDDLAINSAEYFYFTSFIY